MMSCKEDINDISLWCGHHLLLIPPTAVFSLAFVCSSVCISVGNIILKKVLTNSDEIIMTGVNDTRNYYLNCREYCGSSSGCI